MTTTRMTDFRSHHETRRLTNLKEERKKGKKKFKIVYTYTRFLINQNIDKTRETEREHRKLLFYLMAARAKEEHEKI